MHRSVVVPKRKGGLVTDGRRTALLDPVVRAARDEFANVGLPADRILVLRALWRELLIGFTQQLGEHGLRFPQVATLYAAAGTEAISVADLASILGRSPSATSRIVSGLAERGLVVRSEEIADRRQRLVTLTPAGSALLGAFDRARAEQFLAVVRPLPMADRAMVAMGVASLASRAMSRRGRLITSERGG
jgi:DNA-binding MarR family transcriptional regulator